MKTLFVIFITILSVGYSIAQEAEQEKELAGPHIAFSPEVFDFGEITNDKIPDGKVRFKVYNKGNQPLVFLNIRPCCGTVLNDYTQEPIAPADSGFIEVQFTIVPQPHMIRRSVTVVSNAANFPNAILRILGEVIEPGGDLSRRD